jgi:hypothetical protein
MCNLRIFLSLLPIPFISYVHIFSVIRRKVVCQLRKRVLTSFLNLTTNGPRVAYSINLYGINISFIFRKKLTFVYLWCEI